MSNTSGRKKGFSVPCQLLRRGDSAFYVLDANQSSHTVYHPVKKGKPCERGDAVIGPKNISWVKTIRGAREYKVVLVNAKGKYRIPTDRELKLIYTDCKHPTDHTVDIRGTAVPFYDVRWDAENNCLVKQVERKSAKKPKKEEEGEKTKKGGKRKRKEKKSKSKKRRKKKTD